MSFIVPLSQKTEAKPKPIPSTYGTAVYIYIYHIYSIYIIYVYTRDESGAFTYMNG